VRAFLSDTSGATAIEYALVASLIAGAIITTLALLSTTLDNMYTTVGNAVTGS
jgi:pilus assembly protein Flp/PilA